MFIEPWETWVGMPVTWPGHGPLDTYLLLFVTLLESSEVAPCHNQALNPGISMSSSEPGMPRSPGWVGSAHGPREGQEAVVLLQHSIIDHR